MEQASIFTGEFYWLQDLTQSLDVGLVVVDLNDQVVLWNDFMANHHGAAGEDVLGKNLFELFDDLPVDWIKQKMRGVLQFKGRAFTTWEQRPYLFRMGHYRPFTSPAKYMYQNTTIVPLSDISGGFSHIGFIVYDVTDIALQRQQLQEARDKLSTLAKTDALTGLYNRGYWDQCLEIEFDRCRRTGQTPTLMMLDIDHFKLVNDSHGHAAGDEVIRMIANTLKHKLRATDIIGRLGGEEFGVILIDTTAEPSAALANRLRLAIEETITTHEGTDIQVTSSFGISELSEDIQDPKHWYATADAGLYASKAANRNTVTIQKATL